jgi:hypothetical protein
VAPPSCSKPTLVAAILLLMAMLMLAMLLSDRRN